MLIISLLLFSSAVIATACTIHIRRKLVRSIAERKQSSQQEQARYQVLELLAYDKPLAVILAAIVHGVERAQAEMRCSILLIDSEGKHLLVSAAPSLPDLYHSTINGIEIGLGISTCGTAAFTGQRVVAEDIATHPYWINYKNLAQQAMLGACWSEPIRSASGKVLGIFDIYYRQVHLPSKNEVRLIEQTAKLAGIALDRSYADQALKANEKLLSNILENVPAYIYTKDKQSRYLFANRLLRERFAAPMEEIVGYDDHKFFDADTAAEMRESDLRVLLNGETAQNEEINFNQLTGEANVFLSVKQPLPSNDGRIYALCGIAIDISERKDIEEHMSRMAQYDALTHLPNRALFNDRLRQAISAAQRHKEYLALMFIDLDKFKPINDTYGHGVGDQLLKEVAQRIQECLRESDTAARLGGDEFVVLLPTIEAAHDASIVGEKIRLALNRPFTLAGHNLTISSSIGIAVYPTHGDEEKLLVKNADTAMYHAKKTGRNAVKVFQRGMSEIKG